MYTWTATTPSTVTPLTFSTGSVMDAADCEQRKRRGLPIPPVQIRRIVKKADHSGEKWGGGGRPALQIDGDRSFARSFANRLAPERETQHPRRQLGLCKQQQQQRGQPSRSSDRGRSSRRRRPRCADRDLCGSLNARSPLHLFPSLPRLVLYMETIPVQSIDNLHTVFKRHVDSSLSEGRDGVRRRERETT